jgi:hypothetical protein
MRMVERGVRVAEKATVPTSRRAEAAAPRARRVLLMASRYVEVVVQSRSRPFDRRRRR